MTFHGFLGGLALTALVAMAPANARADSSICDALSGNLIQNCGFEGVPPSGNDVTPADWATAQWNDEEDIQGGTINSGSWALRISNDPGQGGPLFNGAAILSQSFSDDPLATYQFTFYLFDGYGFSNASALQFNAYWGTSASPTSGTPVFTDNGGGSPSAGWTEEQFSETGSGSDTITFTGVNGPNWYYLDDVSVVETAAAPSSTPEPGSMILLTLGITGLAGFTRLRRKA